MTSNPAQLGFPAGTSFVVGNNLHQMSLGWGLKVGPQSISETMSIERPLFTRE